MRWLAGPFSAARVRAVWAAATLSVVLAATGCGRKPAPPPGGPPEVSVLTLQPQTVTQTTELPGRTSALLTSDVRPQVNGIVKARLFTEGANVSAGQVLYVIDPGPYRATLDQARGQLANAQAGLTTSRLKAERYADLVKINAVSRQDNDDAQAAYQQSLAAVGQNKAAVESAAINLGYTRVTAPISGRIGRSIYTPGALVTSGQTNALATIQKLDPIYVDVAQSSDALLKLKREMSGGSLTKAGPDGARVKLVLGTGETYPIQGQFRFSDVTVDQTTGSVTLRAVFANPQGLLLPGMFVRAVLIEGLYPNAILAPQSAVTHDPKGDASALVVGPDGRVQPRTVKTAGAYGDNWLVTDGLKAGDRLIVQGAMKVQPGMAVKIVPLATSPTGARGADPAAGQGAAG